MRCSCPISSLRLYIHRVRNVSPEPVADRVQDEGQEQGGRHPWSREDEDNRRREEVQFYSIQQQLDELRRQLKENLARRTAEQQLERQPSYYGSAWVALGRLWLTTDQLGGCAT